MNTPIVEIHDVTFGYNGQVILKDINLDIVEGDLIAMIGPNGGGKTTLLKLILGLLKPNSGTIRVMGQPVPKAAASIGYVPQNVHINRHFPITALDVVLMGRLRSKGRWYRKSAGDQEKALSALERLGAADLAHKKIGALSGGQCQRVFIARALVTEPKLMLLDEPTASIDSRGQADFFGMLKELNTDVTILVVSHDLMVISRYAKSVACMNRTLHHHHRAEITGEMLEAMYPYTQDGLCPVELVAHGLPHRVLSSHAK